DAAVIREQTDAGDARIVDLALHDDDRDVAGGEGVAVLRARQHDAGGQDRWSVLDDDDVLRLVALGVGRDHAHYVRTWPQRHGRPERAPVGGDVFRAVVDLEQDARGGAQHDAP